MKLHSYYQITVEHCGIDSQAKVLERTRRPITAELKDALGVRLPIRIFPWENHWESADFTQESGDFI